MKIPLLYRDEIGLVVLAVLVRVVLMPWFGHEDIFLTYERAHRITEEPQRLIENTSPVPHLIEAGVVSVSEGIIPGDYWADIDQEPVDIQAINSKLFLMKLPYLLAEILFWLLVIRWWKPSKKLLIFILFNPIVIYSVYLFGRYESFVMLFLLLVIESVRRDNLIAGLASTILMLLTRFSLFMVLPAYLVIKPRNRMSARHLTLALIGLVIGVLALVPVVSKLPSLLRGQHFGFLLAGTIDIGFGVEIYLLPLAASILFLILMKYRWIRKIESYDNSVWLAAAMLGYLYLYYALALFHPQYFVWSIVPLAYLMHRLDARSFLRWSAVMQQILFFGVLFVWGGYTTLGLLIPVSDVFWQIGLLGMDEGLKILGSVVKTMLSGLLLMTVYEVIYVLVRRTEDA